MQREKIIYYADELNDEFSTAKITPRVIDEKYKYIHKNPLWDITSLILQNIISMPIKILYSKLKFRIQFIGKEKLKPYKNEGYFIYANHTQEFADTFIPSLGNYPKRNFLIVNPENVSMKFLKTIVEMLGAIPVPENKAATKNFLEIIQKRINQKSSITIYPEAHIWPYYTKIRPFKDVSFKYPVQLEKPTFCMTNTYQIYKKKKGKASSCSDDFKIKIVTYIDGPFWPSEKLNKKEKQKELRNLVYNCMTQRSKNSNVEVIKYVKVEK